MSKLVFSTTTRTKRDRDGRAQAERVNISARILREAPARYVAPVAPVADVPVVIEPRIFLDPAAVEIDDAPVRVDRLSEFRNVERIVTRRQLAKRQPRLTASREEMSRQEQLRLDGIAQQVAIRVRNAWDAAVATGTPEALAGFRDEQRAAHAWGQARGLTAMPQLHTA